MVDYFARLLEAMKLAGWRTDLPENELAHEIKLLTGVSYQAAMKLIKGTSKALNAANHSMTADKLGVDHVWLATGDGNPRPERSWPFELFGRRDFMRIDKAYRERIENELAGEIQRLKKTNGTNGH